MEENLTVFKKPTIGFDMDGVILDMAESQIKIAKGLGFDLKRHHTPYEILRTIMPQIVLEELQKALYQSHFSISTPIMRGAKSVLAALQVEKLPFFLVSRRKIPDIGIETLKKNNLWPKYFNETNSFFVGTPEDKNTQAIKLGLTHFVDDELANIDALSHVPNRFLFDEFNRFNSADHYVRIKSWSEFKKHLLPKKI